MTDSSLLAQLDQLDVPQLRRLLVEHLTLRMPSIHTGIGVYSENA